MVEVDTDDRTLTSYDQLRSGIRPTDVDHDEETQSTLASTGSKESKKSAKSAKSTNSKKLGANQTKSVAVDDGSQLYLKLLPHMRALALQGNSPDAILLRQGLDAIEKSHPPTEAMDGGGKK